MMTIDEAKEKAKEFGDMFETEPVEVSKAFLFYLKELKFDMDEEEQDKIEQDMPIVIVYKDTGKAAITNFFALDNDIQLELIKS